MAEKTNRNGSSGKAACPSSTGGAEIDELSGLCDLDMHMALHSGLLYAFGELPKRPRDWQVPPV